MTGTMTGFALYIFKIFRLFFVLKGISTRLAISGYMTGHTFIVIFFTLADDRLKSI